MRLKLTAFLAISLFVSAAPGLADERDFSEAELAACVAIVEAQFMLVDARDREQISIDDLRPKSDIERKRIALNQHIKTYNALNRMVGQFDDAYNNNCRGSLRHQVYEAVCKQPTDRMQRFLKDGQGCAYWKEKFGE